MPSRILITNRVHEPVLRLLAQHGRLDSNPDPEPWTADEIMRRARDADAIIAFMPDRIDDAFLAACPRLRIVAGALKGYDNFDREAFDRRGVWLTVVPDLLTEPTAELTVGLMIGLARHLLAGDAVVRSGRFGGWRPTLYGTGLAGATVGLFGIGAVGRAIARRLSGFGARLNYTDRAPLTARGEAALGVAWRDRDALLARSDYLVLAAPLLPETRHAIDAAVLRRMKPGALLINPARGSLVDEKAVADALRSGRLGGYAADVFEMEDWARHDRPRRVEPGLLDQPERTLLTPHLGSAVAKVRLEIEMAAARSVVACLSGQVPDGAVNRRPPAMVEAGRHA